MQARQLATELVTVVKQLLELNVKAYQLEVCLNFATVSSDWSTKGQEALFLSTLSSTDKIFALFSIYPVNSSLVGAR